MNTTQSWEKRLIEQQAQKLESYGLQWNDDDYKAFITQELKRAKNDHEHRYTVVVEWKATHKTGKYIESRLPGPQYEDILDRLSAIKVMCSTCLDVKQL